jgi:hypothetical protein
MQVKIKHHRRPAEYVGGGWAAARVPAGPVFDGDVLSVDEWVERLENATR